jgi:hypothetical protein
MSLLLASVGSSAPSGRISRGRGIRSSYPGLLPEAGRPGLDAGTSRCEGFSHPANTSAFSEHSFVDYNAVEGGFEEQWSITARGWEKMEEHSAIFHRIFHLLHTVAQELQEPEHVLIPYEHRYAV